MARPVFSGWSLEAAGNRRPRGMIAAVFRETGEQRIRVSRRSKGAVDGASIAAELGGGGHECASGFSMEGPMPAAVDAVLARLRKIHI